MDTIVEELTDPPDPADACARVLDLPHCLFLDSAARGGELGRFSFVTAEPFMVLRRKMEAHSGAAEDPFTPLARILALYRTDTIPGLPPFQAGVAGYWAYDLCLALEDLPAPPLDDLAMPDLLVGGYDWTLAWDHRQGRAWLISTGLPAPAGAARRQRAAERVAKVRARLAAPPPPRPAMPPASGRGAPPVFLVPGEPGVRSVFTREGYLNAVRRTREYILAGDIFQASLSQRLQAPAGRDPWALYRRLRERNPAPFAAWFDTGDGLILSASPERFLRLKGDRVETRPIKGTAPRGATPAEDFARREALSRSPKNRAENVMIVDLLRNDLSRVCRDGSVHVPELFATERHPTVHHLVSTVVGRLRPELSAADLLRAAFPGGSITGAPKVRAMQIIAELESVRRGVYTGAIGYIGWDGAMDTSIAIRTLVVRGGAGYFGVGGGIVADSDPEREWAETLDKAAGLLAALEEDDGAADR